MKTLTKIMAFILAVTAAASPIYAAQPDKSIIVSSAANTVEQDGMTFTVREDRNMEVLLKKIGDISGNVELPEKVGEYKVTGIDNAAFKKCKTVGKVTIPDTYSYFGKEIFSKSSVTSVNIPKSLRIIPDDTFLGCTSLKNVTFHDNIAYISSTAFTDTSVSIPDALAERVSTRYTPTYCNYQ